MEKEAFNASTGTSVHPIMKSKIRHKKKKYLLIIFFFEGNSWILWTCQAHALRWTQQQDLQQYLRYEWWAEAWEIYQPGSLFTASHCWRPITLLIHLCSCYLLGEHLGLTNHCFCCPTFNHSPLNPTSDPFIWGRLPRMLKLSFLG